MKISIIAAMDKHRLIGSDGKLPWKLPADLKYFHEKTCNKTVVMGSKTYASIGIPLANRRNIILSHNKNLNIDGCEVYGSCSQVLAAIKHEREIFVIGGAEIYSLFLPLAAKLYLTVIMEAFLGDRYFPKFNQFNWKIIFQSKHCADSINNYDYQHQILIKKFAKYSC